MNETLLAIIVFGFVITVLLTLLLVKLSRKNDNEQDQTFLILQDQLERLRNTVEEKLERSQSELYHVLDRQENKSQRLMLDITEKLTEVREGNKQVFSMTEQLQNLQDILKNPKQRGILGEYYLETLLKNVMPPGSYEMQYHFPDETIVDAVVFVKDKVIPIDSKFSLENYNRISETDDKGEKERYEKIFLNDLKNRIVETSKYIQPEQNTMDFAFMFIPHEAIYYDLIVNKIGAVTEDTENLIQRAASKYKVIIVSPTSFLAYLQTVLQGLKAMQIEESAKDIVKRVGELGKHLKSYEEHHNKLGNTLSTVINHYSNSSKELKKVDKDVLRITGEASGIDPVLLDKPNFSDE
ncbi:MAG: DNA recombination protein RmuC [Candidatus Pacebacteria bacterium]|nr:DNA recombination protein RmuC [Candidatus Paceibacterota bacterium]